VAPGGSVFMRARRPRSFERLPSTACVARLPFWISVWPASPSRTSRQNIRARGKALREEGTDSTGGAASAAQGVLADHIGLQLSYLLPAVCYVYVLFYALWGSKPTAALQDEQLV
jgi:hypothetical protein